MTRARNHAGSAPHEGEAAPERRATPPRPTTACRLRLLTVNEVAELLQVSSKTARRWIELQHLVVREECLRRRRSVGFVTAASIRFRRLPDREGRKACDFVRPRTRGIPAGARP
jgi:hypothetical protein